MDFKLLKSFVTVANNKNFSKSANILNYAQSTVSEQIKKLESELGTKLFERLGSNISLTLDGRKFLPYAEKILNLYDESLEILSPYSSSEVKGKLRIAITETLCVFSLPKLFRDYRTLYPNVELKIKIGSCYDFPYWIRQNLVDVAFSLDNRNNYSDLTCETLFLEPLILVTNKNHPFAKKSIIDASELENEDLILTQNGSEYRAIFESYLISMNIRPKSILEFESIAAMKQFVIDGLGISFLPEITVKNELLRGDLYKISVKNQDFSIPAQMAFHHNKWISPALKSLLDLTHKFIKS